MNHIAEEYAELNEKLKKNENAIDACKLQITREPFEFPTVFINQIKENINDYRVEDFEIHNYNHHAAIKVPMVV